MKKVLKWLCVVLWMILIFYLSNESGVESTGTSHFFVEKVEGFFFKFIPDFSLSTITLFVRKTAHFFLYFILELLIFHAIDGKEKYTGSLLICILYACMDEIHQLFIVGRSGQLFDVLIDVTGSSVGLLLCFLFFHFYGNKNEQNE